MVCARHRGLLGSSQRTQISPVSLSGVAFRRPEDRLQLFYALFDSELFLDLIKRLVLFSNVVIMIIIHMHIGTLNICKAYRELVTCKIIIRGKMRDKDSNGNSNNVMKMQKEYIPSSFR